MSKTLIYAFAALALLLMLSNLGWWAHASALGLQRDVAAADADTATAMRDAALTEKQAWKNKAGELEVANLATQKTIGYLQTELQRSQGERRRLEAAGQHAVAAAQAEAADADRTLKTFIARYAQQLSNPDCAGALAVLQQACPAMSGY